MAYLTSHLSPFTSLGNFFGVSTDLLHSVGSACFCHLLRTPIPKLCTFLRLCHPPTSDDIKVVVTDPSSQPSLSWFFSDLLHIGDYGEFCCNIVNSLFCAINSIILMLSLLLGIDSALVYSKLINLTHRFCCMPDMVSWGKKIDLGLNFSHCEGGIVILEWKVHFAIKQV